MGKKKGGGESGGETDMEHDIQYISDWCSHHDN